MVFLSTSYFPPISYLTLLIKLGDPIIDIYEHYIKQTYRNRCIIAAANGALSLSVPVIKNDLKKTITKDIMIDYSMNWQNNHWRSIESAYNNSPFFLYYRDRLEKCIFNKYNFLIDLNYNLLNILFEQLLVDIKLSFTDKYIDTITEKNDFRNSISPKTKLQNNFPFYQQVFSEKYDFISDLSIIDLLFNIGPNSKDYLNNIKQGIQF